MTVCQRVSALTPALVVRDCEPRDLACVLLLASEFHAVNRELAPEDYTPTFDPSGADAMMREAMLAGDQILAVAELAGLVVGYVWGQVMSRPRSAFRPGARFLFVSQVYVATWARRKGLCAALLGFIAGDAVKHGATEVLLDVVTSNDGAADAFRAAGFKPSTLIMRSEVPVFATLSHTHSPSGPADQSSP